MNTAATERAWLHGNYDASLLTPEASPRRYYRSPHPDTRGWLRVISPTPPPRAMTEFLHGLGVRTPRLGPQREDVYLVEDLGDLHLAHQPEARAYRQVLDAHRRYFIAELPVDHPNRTLALDRCLFNRELEQFAHEYLEPFCQRDLRAHELQEIRAFLPRLAEHAAAGPQALQHRDLHSRNVLLIDDGIALIDHQDLRRGPLFYDLASLATDAYVDFSGEVQEFLHSEKLWLAEASGLSEVEAERQYFATAMQRVLKALGTFGRLITAGREDYRAAAKRARAAGSRLLAESPQEHAALACPRALNMVLDS